MAGQIRWFTWFLEDLDKTTSRHHHQDVTRELKLSSWMALRGLVIDVRLWKDASQYEALMRSFKEAFPERPYQPFWDNFKEITGRIQWVIKVKRQYFVRLITDEKSFKIDIPIKAVVSTRSTGFPKVAYNVEKYIVGYMSWLDAFEQAKHTQVKDCSLLDKLTPMFIKNNYSDAVYAKIKQLNKLIRHQGVSHAYEEKSIEEAIKSLETLMIDEMNKEILEQCKGMYHHALEWHVDKEVLKRNHPLIKAYLVIRERIKGIVPGEMFIEVN
jgi:hypothetical protein